MMMMVDFFDCTTCSYASFPVPVGDDYIYLGAFFQQISHTYLLKHWYQITANLHTYIHVCTRNHTATQERSALVLTVKPLNDRNTHLMVENGHHPQLIIKQEADYNSWLGYMYIVIKTPVADDLQLKREKNKSPVRLEFHPTCDTATQPSFCAY